MLIPATVVLLFPFYWLIVTSLETAPEALHFPPILIPHAIRFANYSDALASAPFVRFFVNSAIVTVTTVLCNLVLCSLAGYAFARFRFLGRSALFAVLMATLMVPFQVTMIPQFIVAKWLGVHVLAGVGHRPPRRAHPAQRGHRLRHLLHAAVLPHPAARVRGVRPGGRGEQAHRARQDRAAAGHRRRSPRSPR